MTDPDTLVAQLTALRDQRRAALLAEMERTGQPSGFVWAGGYTIAPDGTLRYVTPTEIAQRREDLIAQLDAAIDARYGAWLLAQSEE